MWHSIFNLDPSIVEKIVRPILIYGFLLVAIRLGGHREIGQTNALQLVLLLAVANAVQNGIIGVDDSVTGAVIGAMTLFVANGIVMLLASRSQRFHNLVIGRSIELVAAGKVNMHALNRQRISEQDLLVAATKQGATEIGDINHAVLAENGDIVVTLYAHLKLQDQIKALSDQVTALQRLVESKIVK